MKRIIAIAALMAAFIGNTVAQNDKPVAEKDVKVSYVKDFQRQVKNATNVAWWQVDSTAYKVTYLDADKSREAMVFSSKGTETLYYVEDQYWPASVRDTVKHLYPHHTITELWARKVRGKMTYQARIAQKSGFLWWKKEKDARILNWEIDGKFIGEN